MVLVSLMAQGARAQDDAGVLRLYQGGLEVGRETFRASGRELETSVLIPMIRVRITARVTRDEAGRPVRLEERVYTLPADTVVRAYTATIDGDSVRLTMAAGSNTRRWAKAASPDELAADQSLAAFFHLVQRAAHRDQVYHVWLPNADTVLDFPVTFTGDTAHTTLGPQTAVFHLGADGRVRAADFPQSRVHYERYLGSVEIPPLPGAVPPRTDYTAPATAPYTADAVRVPVVGLRGDSFELGCTLTRPKSGGPRFPAAITLTGSGQQDRDENLWPLVSDYHLYRQVAERLAAAGIAVLRCDDYGFGESGGRLDSTISMLDFAHAAQAQLAWLRARSDIDGARLAVIGHSEGGIVGPMVAAEDPRLRAVVIMAGTGKTMAEVLRDQFLGAVDRTAGLALEQRTAARAQAIRDADAFGANAPGYMRQARTYDPLTAARRLRMPVLILQGILDQQVTHGQADTLAAAMRAAGNRDVTVRKFDRLNHLFLVSPDGTGAPDEYGTLRDVAVPAAVLDTLADWLRLRLH